LYSCRFEIDHVSEIFEKVHANITPKPLLSGGDPVGLEHNKEKMKSLLDDTESLIILYECLSFMNFAE
jgi:hypothetical protein